MVSSGGLGTCLLLELLKHAGSQLLGLELHLALAVTLPRCGLDHSLVPRYLP